MQKALSVAEKMGEGMGRSEILQRTVQAKPLTIFRRGKQAFVE
jgi:hypothetical protein